MYVLPPASGATRGARFCASWGRKNRPENRRSFTPASRQRSRRAPAIWSGRWSDCNYYAREQSLSVKGEFTDAASSLNQRRRGLTNVLKLAERGEYRKPIIEYPDRLARFGYEYLERHLRYCGVEIIAIAEKELEDAQSELVRDLRAIVMSFSARLYGGGGGRRINRKFRELIAGAEEEKTCQ